MICTVQQGFKKGTKKTSIWMEVREGITRRNSHLWFVNSELYRSKVDWPFLGIFYLKGFWNEIINRFLFRKKSGMEWVIKGYYLLMVIQDSFVILLEQFSIDVANYFLHWFLSCFSWAEELIYSLSGLESIQVRSGTDPSTYEKIK